ncbi:MAG: TIM barrel protein [Candidatus Omnitrophota bacterium]|nr:sugar phosphate isomerase/epimerase [Candidatus Omnitrophota bacterium]
MPLAISTSWNAFRHKQALAIVDELKDLGFNAIELSFNLTPSIVKDIEKLVRNNKISVVSLHNYCPIPEGFNRVEALPDCLSLSSLDEEERVLAVKQTKHTIDNARKLAARAVVLHCGRVEIADRTRDLISLYQLGDKGSGTYKKIKQCFIQSREKQKKPFFENILRSLDELNSYAIKCGIKLGVENRFYYREIPSWEEIGYILEKFKGSGVCYWHDVGHAQVMENLGFNSHIDFLNSYSRRMLGMHLHDIIGCQDHQAIGKGNLDLRHITSYLPEDALRVVEIHGQAKADEIKLSRSFLEEIFHGRS